MAEEKTVLENTNAAADTIVEREFASMKDQLADIKTSLEELTTKHEEALATIGKFEEAEVSRAEEESNVRRTSFVNTIIEKETLLGNVKDDDKDARAEELTSWDEVKLEGFSIAMASMPVPEDASRTFGKGKAHDDSEKAVEEAEETERMFALENGRIVFKGVGIGD
jgi:seryl-tRNA synthetase